MKNSDYIQLPPFKRDTDGEVVKMIWEYLKLSKDEQEIVHSDLKAIVKKDKLEKPDYPEECQQVRHEEVDSFKETVSSLIRDIVLEASDIACWVFARKFIDGWTLEQMLADMPHAFKFIIAMDTLFEQNMKPVDEKEEQPTQ